MQNLLNDLKTLLQNDDRLVDENGVLLKNKIIELALRLDGNLLRLLLKHESLRNHFFASVDGVLVFDKIKFQQFVSNKQFLPDSYTAYKNKIGLTAGNEQYLTDSKEVVLAWAYKDCILEGGQTREDVRRNEVFWNETLAPDEIDCLLKPKVLTNFKKFDKDGEHRVTSVGIADNLIIKGNNLLALHTLKKVYAGKVKLIYIDPPYNTGSDSFLYNDKFNHSTWLTFMKNRLEVARELLRDDGVIFVQCDDNEQAYLKVLMDEVFGRENFANTVTTRSTPNARDYGLIAQMHEFILFYAKNISLAKTNLLDVENKDFDFEDQKGKFNIHPLYNSNVNFHIDNRKNLYYPFYLNLSKVDKHGFYEISLEKTSEAIEVFPPKSIKEQIQFVWRWGKEKSLENLNQEIVGYKTRDGEYRVVQKMRNSKQLARSIWLETEISNRRATEDLQKLYNKKAFSFPKSEYLLQKIINIATNEGDLVLDFFAGCGTTLAAAHKLNRRYIGIEQMDYIHELPEARLKKVIEGEQGGISKTANWQGGGSFIYCELTEANQAFIDSIQSATNTQILQEIYAAMQEKAFLSYKIAPKTINLKSTDFTTLNLEDQKRFLTEILDKNMLYVPLSEIEDETYNVSTEDKRINRLFYGEE